MPAKGWPLPFPSACVELRGLPDVGAHALVGNLRAAIEQRDVLPRASERLFERVRCRNVTLQQWRTMMSENYRRNSLEFINRAGAEPNVARRSLFLDLAVIYARLADLVNEDRAGLS